MTKEPISKSPRLKGLLIRITEEGKTQPEVRIPYFVFKTGMKLGKIAGGKKNSGREWEMLNALDMDLVLESLNNGEQSLPCLLTEVDDAEKNQHIEIWLE